MTKLIFSTVFVFVYPWIWLLGVQGQSYQDLKTLHQNLFSNYSTYMRPLLNQSNTIVLSPAFELISLVELDEISQKVNMNGLLALTWKDELLTWNPSTYNGISYIAPDSTLIWKPRFVLLNTMSDRDLFKDDYAPINILYDGTVSWYPGGLFPISCLLDLRKFPFDKHNCAMQLSPMYMNASDVTFDMTYAGVSRALFYPHGEWDVTESHMSSVVFTPGNHISYVRLDIHLTISRKPAFFIFSVYFPVVFLCAINLLTFLIPSSEGERIGFSMAVLLSMAVYMGIVSDKQPSNSENMPYMTHYIFLLFALSVICCMDNVFIVWLHTKEEEEEKKLKRQSKLKNVSHKLGILNACKQSRNPSDKTKIFPRLFHRGGTPSEVDPSTKDVEEIFTKLRRVKLIPAPTGGTPSEVDPSTNDDEEIFTIHTPAAFTPNPAASPKKIQDEVRIISAKAELTIPDVHTTEKDCSGRNVADVPRNRYKNKAQKINKYSAIVFCFMSFTVTLIYLILMTS